MVSSKLVQKPVAPFGQQPVDQLQSSENQIDTIELPTIGQIGKTRRW